MGDETIDIVYTWVDSSQQGFQQLVNTYQPGLLQRQAARFRNNNELMYSMRGVWQNLSFRKIFIVTNGQVPPFLDLADERICIVNHRDIFPDARDLPVFNSMAIESHLHRIDGLAECFIYFNDDLFVSRPIQSSTMSGSDGRGAFLLSRHSLNRGEISGWAKSLQSTEDLLLRRFGDFSRALLTHTPQLFCRRTCVEVSEIWAVALRNTSSSRFRKNSDVLFRLLYAYYVIYDRYGVRDLEEVLALASSTEVQPSRRTYQTIAVPCGQSTLIEGLIASPPAFLSVQDVGGGDDDPAVEIERLLSALFPTPAPWELER